ncbi:hypothetical protein D3C80_732150 [compost metagenome]
MRADGVVRGDSLGHQVRVLRLDANIDMLAEVTVRPAIECAVFHRGDVVGYQVAADFIPFVDRGPQRATVRFPGHAVGVAQAGREDPLLAGGAIHFPDRRATFFLVHAVFRNVAVGTHGDVQLAAVLAGDDVFGPVVIQQAARQVDHFCRR